MTNPSLPLFEALGPLALHSFFLLVPAFFLWLASSLAEALAEARSHVEAVSLVVSMLAVLAFALTLLYAGLKVWWTSLLFFISLT